MLSDMLMRSAVQCTVLMMVSALHSPTMPHDTLEWTKRFRETFCLNLRIRYPNVGGDRFLQHTGTDLPNDTAPHHRTL